MRTMNHGSPLGDAQTGGYMNVLRTIDEMDNFYSIDMEILTDYFNLNILNLKNRF